MNDKTAAATPLLERLRRVPNDARLEYEHDPCHHSVFPIGAMCHEAATHIEALEAELAKAKVPHWFYHPDYTEVCEFSPWDVIDGRYDPEPGDHVFEIECARPLPSIWCAVRVNADPDADERFTFTEHSSEAEARKALEGAGND